MSSSASAPAARQPAGLTRVVAASLIGTTIEWYDFFLSAACVVTTVALLFAKETKGRDLTAVTPSSGPALTLPHVPEPATEA